jgi:serine/threonine protein kinase/predicted Zn-dependent protease
MNETRSGSTWEEASSPGISFAVRRFESDWRSSSGHRPAPQDYLPESPEERPAALLALLRADLVLRWEVDEPRRVEWYRDQFPELEDDAVVALLYEEYCLREEAGESPESAEYTARFPDLACSFEEVLEIHDLIGRAPAPSLRSTYQAGSALPEVGQTIAGFRLVEELGRGAFGRAYLAEEQHLADRPVALKVTRTGSREPQTLARLQHTHIVPVYSYRTDSSTGLHLLCMPYLGRVTLLHLLNDPAIREARSGADLLMVIDRLQPPDARSEERTTARRALERRSYARAISFWGARMAEALQHAHDRGVLHRDVKPSNVLVTGDGLPMLLDFNLALAPQIDDHEAIPGGLGGTLAYMAPEHLEALASGATESVDARSDIYALGVVLFDCLIRGARAFAMPSRRGTMAESLFRAAAARRAGPPRLRATQPDVPVALECVVQRCLAADPDDRYPSASELAADLQAVADDGPLRFAHEPIVSRGVRWVRRNRRRLALGVPIALGLALSSYTLFSAWLAESRLESDVLQWVEEGDRSASEDRLELAQSQFASAASLAEGSAGLAGLREQIGEKIRRVQETKEARYKVDELFDEGERLRFELLGFSGEPGEACKAVETALAGFAIPADRGWIRRSEVGLLNAPRRDRLVAEVNELLFLWAVALDRDRRGDQAARRGAVRICEAAMAFAQPLGPWRALRDRLGAATGEGPAAAREAPHPAAESSSRGCLQWAILADLDGRTEDALAWLERATLLEQDNYWAQFYLGYHYKRAGQNGRALVHYQAAVILRPDSPWARYNRAILYQSLGDWDQALDDLNRILASQQGTELPAARLELGVVKQLLGDEAGARAAYEAVIASAVGGSMARAGRLNRAKLDIDSGATDRAWAEYQALLNENPRDAPARLGRALLALRTGRFEQAEADLDLLLRDAPEQADEILARRAMARLALGRAEEAEADALAAFRRRPTPSHERLWARTLLALGRALDLCWLDEPEELALLPAGGPELRADLRAAAAQLKAATGSTKTLIRRPLAHRGRAVILCAVGSPAALAEATAAIDASPESAEAYLVRARIRRQAGDRAAALADVESGLSLVPGDPRLLELRGRLKIESDNPAGALADLDRALIRGAPPSARLQRARALSALGRDEAAVREWSLAVDQDPEDPRAFLGRASAFLKLKRTDRAVVDLEQAADWAPEDPALLIRIAATYASCLPSRPDRFSRWLALARRACAAWITSRSNP